ncbi:MAG: calcineurin-like phosphoesterase, partial [Harvfovirus sp.]
AAAVATAATAASAERDKLQREAAEKKKKDEAEAAENKKRDDAVAAAAVAAVAERDRLQRQAAAPAAAPAVAPAAAAPLLFSPTIELYEYKIKDYTKDQSHSFKEGFKSSQDKCGVISVGATDVKPTEPDTNLSSCDVIESNALEDWEKILNDRLKKEPASSSPVLGAYFFPTLKKIYEEYKTLQSRSTIPTLKTKPIWQFDDSNYNDLILKLGGLELRYDRFFKPVDKANILENSYIQKVVINSTEKMIIVGDIHGGLHTFLRLMFRFHILGVLNIKTLKITPGYRLIFLGDVIDRGNYSLEILLIIFNLLFYNNDNYLNPNVIYIRGNHETLDMNSLDGLKDEINARLDPRRAKILFDKINEMYNYIPCAVVLRVKHHNAIRKNYWLCHGGFDPSFLEDNNKLIRDLSRNPLQAGYIILDATLDVSDYSMKMNIMWSDFIDYDTADVENSPRGAGKKYNRFHVHKFLTTNKIDFIIRGHQDNYDNNYLFGTTRIADGNPMPGIGINTKELVIKREDNLPLVFYNKKKVRVGSEERSVGPIASLIADSSVYNEGIWGGPGTFFYGLLDMGDDVKRSKPLNVFPVLTLSTNTDLLRRLRADSFALLRFDKEAKDVSENPLHASNYLEMMGGGSYWKKYQKYKGKYLKYKKIDH